MSSGGNKRAGEAKETKKQQRRRQTPNSNVATLSNRIQPKPTPPPPEPLVKLIKSDSSVLSYFQSLQANLDFDVQQWKDRATRYRNKYNELLAEKSTRKEEKSPKKARTNRGKNGGSVARNGISNRKDEKTSAYPSKEGGTKNIETEECSWNCKPQKNKTENHHGVAIDDAMLDDMFASSSDEENNDTEDQKSRINDTNVEVDENTEATTNAIVDRHFYNDLVEAYQSLELLGIQLVEIDKPNNENESESEKKTEETTFDLDGKPSIDGRWSLVRRDDSEVIADLVYVIRTLSRVQSPASNVSAVVSGVSFLTSQMIPCCSDISFGDMVKNDTKIHHPAVDGLKLIFRSLLIMDVYCPLLPDNEWNSIFPSEEISMESESIRVGMKNRHYMVESFMASLHGEITSEWGFSDRSVRLTTTSLHFSIESPSSEIDETGGVKQQAQISTSAKDHSRLSALIERCMYAQLVSSFYRQQQNATETAFLVWNYILSTVPSLNVEEYPKLQPALSLCVLEALLVTNEELLKTNSGNINWFLTKLMKLPSCVGDKKTGSLVTKAIVLAIQTTSQILKQRCKSTDDRLSNYSKVEAACYNRFEGSELLPFLKPELMDVSTLDECRSFALSIVRDALVILCPDKKDSNPDKAALRWCGDEQQDERDILDASLAIQLALIIVGESDVIQEIFERSVNATKQLASTDGMIQYIRCSGICTLFVSCSISFRQIHIRQIDGFRLRHNTFQSNSKANRQPSIDLSGLMKALSTCNFTGEVFWSLVASIGNCCLQLSDGETAYSLVSLLVRCNDKNNECTRISNDRSRNQFVDATADLLTVGQTPTIRVINLHRRPDRMETFFSQAQHQQCLVVKSVANILDTHDNILTEIDSVDGFEHYFWGGHSFDGQGRALEAHQRFSKLTGGNLDDFVSTHWRPGDLRAFDKGARDDEELVRTSPSEKGCALSHIASWKGVARSLEIEPPTRQQGSNIFDQNTLFQHPQNLLRLFRISGFARGKALLHENESMPPMPCCVVLEDDAVLVDRFRDRLSSLLEELPRDFHFCSLGYSRPKTAPILKYSSEVGIPSCLWFLTGYVISLDGAKYLLNALPVVGPVDSWVGLRMCANWENVFGQKIGVGNSALPSGVTPSRKDLSAILRFRAFCALVPLCSQKAGLGSCGDPSAVRRSWKQQDTDVVYSGNQPPDQDKRAGYRLKGKEY